MPVTLLDRPPHFLLQCAHLPRYKALASEIGGRKIPTGYAFPRLMSVYDQLQARIPNLNQIDVPNARGYPLIDRGQTAHPAWPKLRDYQRDTVDLLLSCPHPGMLVELSPGLGKSPVSVVAADVAGYKDVLFVAVKSLRRNWEREIRAWSGREPITRFQEGPVPGEWNIVNYDTLVGFYKRAHPVEKNDKSAPAPQPDPYLRHYDLIVLDESVLIKNPKAKRTKAINALRPFADRIWCLTGSPTTRYANDLWSQLHVCHPKGFGSYWRFAKQFCILDETVFGTQVIGTKPDVDFEWSLRDCVITINQKDVLDLPPLLHESVDLDLTPEQQRVYDDLLDSFVSELESGVVLSTPNRMARLIRLQQVISNLANVEGGDYSSKADAVEELIEAHAVEFPLLIWVHWTPGAHRLYDRLIKSKVRVGIVLGSTKENEATIDRYKSGDLDCLLLSLGVGKYGHTLTDTRSVIYVDRTFDGDAYYQSLHRLERFGLQHSPQVITLRIPGTVEQFNVEENLAGKMQTISTITNADLVKLMKSLGRV